MVKQNRHADENRHVGLTAPQGLSWPRLTCWDPGAAAMPGCHPVLLGELIRLPEGPHRALLHLPTIPEEEWEQPQQT